MAEFYIGTDWRGRQQWSPIVVVKVDYIADTHGVKGRDPARFTAADLLPRFGVVGLERFTDRSYRDILLYIDRIILKHDAIVGKSVEVLAAINDVGRAIERLLDGMSFTPALVSISAHGGVSSYAENLYTIPRSELIAALANAFQTSMVRLAAGMKYAPVLNTQLVDLQIRSDIGAKLTRDSKETANEDLATALAMCVWMATQDHRRDRTYLDRLATESSAPSKKGWDPYRYARQREGVYDGVR